jgi:hypothetical protein
VDEKAVLQAVTQVTMQVDEAVFHIRILCHTDDGEVVVQVQRGLDGEYVVVQVVDGELNIERVQILLELKQEQHHVEETKIEQVSRSQIVEV